MAFQTGTSSSIENLMTQLSTFLTANGWTQNFYNSGSEPGSIAFSKNSVFVSFQWSEAQGFLAIYQALAADQSPTTQPWTATDDSGQGSSSTSPGTFINGRGVNNIAGPHAAYWFFENDANPAYCHIVLEADAGRYRHFGFGELEKIGDGWVGGEYSYGHYQDQSSSRIDVPNSSFHSWMMDSYAASVFTRAACVHVEDLTGEPNAATKWALACVVSNAGNDRSGIQRWSGQGGVRGGPMSNGYLGFQISLAQAYKPLFPIPFWAADYAANPDIMTLLGYQADVRVCNIGQIQPNQVINIAGDNWYFFPIIRKQYLQNNTEETWNAGIAYRRVDA